ncbi:response regulator transcription factor [Kineosporia sp. R_H_3]|uniref:response regulator n=1 Tax=Kineosporia sp. R_H_3 TaxID=1961848 RepID=UPI0018E98DF8|nr:response regulator transcription factor [Kineosporia sp. R_H_3]
MTETVSILLVEDHPTFRLGLRTRIELEDDLEVVADLATAEEAITRVEDLMPDVVVVDLNLPGMDGIELTRELTRRAPSVRILVLTMLDDDHAFEALRAGATGYLVKDASPSQIVNSIRVVAQGGAVFSAGIAARLMNRPPGAGARRYGELSERETEILSLVAQGLTNHEIGRRLFLSPKTVRNYVSNVIGKLQVADREAAAVAGRAAGLVSQKEPGGAEDTR